MPTTGDEDDGATPRGHVLIVEDDVPTARFLVRALERAGYVVAAVGDAIAAERHLAEAECDALVVDIGLPGPSGFDLVREMKAAHPHLPVALMTADASMDVAVQALRSEVDDFLAKPIDPAALVEQVDRLVRRSRAAGAGVERVVAVGAHPADVEIGIGGTLLWHRFVGDEVAVVTLRRGADAEAARAAELLGVRLVAHGLEPTQREVGDEAAELVAAIAAVVADVDPTIVYVPSDSDADRDHRNTHRASLSAAREVPGLYCYAAPSATVDFRPSRFVAVDPFVEAKIEAIGAYATWPEAGPYLDPDLVRSTGRYWGHLGDSRYCEPLEVLRDGPAQGRNRGYATDSLVTGR
jgi:CheY-like chemotaxis protein